jgi:4-hydroxy-tetrahydrodipicolinate reductase
MPRGRSAVPARGRTRDKGTGPRIVVAGAAGRLGRAIVRSAVSHGLLVVGAVDRIPVPAQGGSPRIDRATPRELARLLDGADVFLSATTAAAERANLPIVARASVPSVVATTGIGPPVPAWLRSCARRIPIVLDSNFSIGMGILRAAVRSIGPLPEGFDVSIVEAHRREKADHPSGTARGLSEDLARSGLTGWEEARGRRTPGRVEIASLRGSETPGIHVVQIAGPSELVRFEHLVYGREAFSEGMIRAAEWLNASRGERAPGLYSLKDVLGEGGR